MLRTLMTILVMGMIAVASYLFNITQNLPSVDKVLREGINPTKWTQVFASDGTPILSFGKFRHQSVRIDNVSPYFLDALIATEDRRFYTHRGVDPVAVLRAVVSDLTHKKIREGGSTLTQQLARNVFLNNERSMARKVREASLAMKLEESLTKKQILELYVNNTYFGEGAYGIEAASEIYFGKAPNRLTIPEAALLAGLPQAPSAYSPYQNLKGAKRRRNEVLDNLRDVGKITSSQAEMYKQSAIRLNPNGRSLSASNRAPFFNQYIMARVIRFLNLDEQSFWQSGLKINTTLDLNAQRLAERTLVTQSLAAGRTGARQQAALVSLNAQSGAILAYVGGKNYQRSQFDRVSNATRSPGSLFKVFTYTAAIDKGYEPTRVYLDEPIRIGNWQPQNYDRTYHGYMTLARALITSDNVVAVKVIHEIGADNVIRLAQQMGIHSILEPYLGLTLGGSGVRVMEISSAFGVLANQGVRVEPYGISSIIDDSGHEIYREHAIKVNVLNRTTVDTMVRMMESVIARGTGKAADIGRPAAGKTGTSDDYRDAWFVGFTPDVVTGVWVGNDDNTPMPGMTGGSLPARIWRGYMGAYMANRPIKNFDLAFAKPLKDEDFTTYNLRNLSDKDNGMSADPLPNDLQPAPDSNQPLVDESGPNAAPKEDDNTDDEGDNRDNRSNDDNQLQQQPLYQPRAVPQPPPLQPQPMPGYDRSSAAPPSRPIRRTNDYSRSYEDLQPLVPQR
jgi:penicillin-binding protein 1A